MDTHSTPCSKTIMLKCHNVIIHHGFKHGDSSYHTNQPTCKSVDEAVVAGREEEGSSAVRIWTTFGVGVPVVLNLSVFNQIEILYYNQGRPGKEI